MSRVFKETYTSQQNYVVERKNQIIISVVQSVLKKKKNPITFWLEVVNLEVHILSKAQHLR